VELKSTVEKESKSTVEKGGNSGEYYEIRVDANRFTLSGRSAHGVFNACQSLLNMLGNAPRLPAGFANMQIVDMPDTDHRGMMLDVSRNFTKK
jgi:hexosaminidase